MTTPQKNAKQGTGFFLPSYGALKHAQRGAADGDRSCSPDQAAESNPFSVVLERKRQEVLLQQAFKNAHCASFAPGPFFDQVLVPSAAPFCSGSSFAAIVATDAAALSEPYLSEPYPLSPCHSTSSSGSGYWPSQQPTGILPATGSMASLAGPLQYFNVTPTLDQEALQEMLLLQQQQAEVDAAINTMLALRQQLAAAMPAPAPTAAPLFAGAAPVSRATAALAAQLDMPLYGTTPAAAGVAPASGGSPTATAQLHLAQLQAEQQQLLDVEQQLQLRLQAEVARLVALG